MKGVLLTLTALPLLGELIRHPEDKDVMKDAFDDTKRYRTLLDTWGDIRGGVAGFL